MVWQPRIVSADGELDSATHQESAPLVPLPLSGDYAHPPRKRPQVNRNVDAEFGAIMNGVSRLSIDDLLDRPKRSRMKIVNAVALEIAAFADEVVLQVHRIGNGYQAEDIRARLQRASRLYDDLGRLIEYGRMIDEEQRETAKPI